MLNGLMLFMLNDHDMNLFRYALVEKSSKFRFESIIYGWIKLSKNLVVNFRETLPHAIEGLHRNKDSVFHHDHV